MRARDLGFELWIPNGKRRRVSQRVGLSMRNQASGADMVGPQPGRRCLPCGAWRNWSATKLREAKMKKKIRQ